MKTIILPHSPERPLAPFVLVHLMQKASFSSPQNVVTGKIYGLVEVSHGQAQPQHTVRQVDCPLSCLQSLCRVPQTHHWSKEKKSRTRKISELHKFTSRAVCRTLLLGKKDEVVGSLTLSGKAHVGFQPCNRFQKLTTCTALLKSVA